jgi:hypothetical protein
MGFLNNLFGTIAEGAALYRAPGNIGFIPADGAGNVIDIKGWDAVWLGLRNPLQQLKAYEFCSALASVIDRLAEMDLNGKPDILRLNGKGKDDYATSEFATKMNTLFKQPNPLQSWESFRAQQNVYKRVFGFCPVMPINPAGMPSPEDAYQMWNLPPWLFDFEATRKLLRQPSIRDMVKYWKININGDEVQIPADKLFIVEDSYLLDPEKYYLVPKSRLVGLDMAVSNYCAAMEAENVLLKKKGPLGFISHDPPQDAIKGVVPMLQSDKDRLQADLANYGLTLGQFQYVISRTPVKWNPVSFDVKQLGVEDTLIRATKEICHRFGYPYLMLEQTEGAYSASGQRAHLGVYQDIVIPANCRDMTKYEKYFNFDANNCKIEADFTHLPILQLDKKNEADALKAQTEALLLQYKNDIITKNMMLRALGLETVPDGDQYYSQTEAYARATQGQSGQTGSDQGQAEG